MLALTRKVGEVVEIGPYVKVVVAKASAGQVRLGIEAPVGSRISRTDGDPTERLPIHDRDDDQWFGYASVPGLELAVDASGCIVLHTDSEGSYTITDVNQMVSALERARSARDAIEEGARDAREA